MRFLFNFKEGGDKSGVTSLDELLVGDGKLVDVVVEFQLRLEALVSAPVMRGGLYGAFPRRPLQWTPPFRVSGG